MPKRSNVSDLKKYLVNLIRHENISNQELMRITHQNSSQVSKWLNEYDNSFPNMQELLIICQRLGISLNELYEMDDAKLYDNLKLEKYALWDDGTIDGCITYEYIDPCYYLSTKVFEDHECTEILESYVKLFRDFNNKTNNYLKGITKDIPSLEIEKLLVYYVDRDIEIDGMDKYDFDDFKEFIDNKDYIDSKHTNPHFYPINADYVMLLYMKKDKKLVFEYLEELKKLDNFFDYSNILKNKYVSQFFNVYSYLLEQNQIIDSQGKLFKKIVDSGGVLGDEKRYAHIIAKLIPNR